MQMNSMKVFVSCASAALILLAPGCINLNKLADKLKDDPADIHLRVVTFSATVDFERHMPTNWVSPYSQPKLVRGAFVGGSSTLTTAVVPGNTNLPPFITH